MGKESGFTVSLRADKAPRPEDVAGLGTSWPEGKRKTDKIVVFSFSTLKRAQAFREQYRDALA